MFERVCVCASRCVACAGVLDCYVECNRLFVGMEINVLHTVEEEVLLLSVEFYWFFLSLSTPTMRSVYTAGYFPTKSLRIICLNSIWPRCFAHSWLFSLICTRYVWLRHRTRFAHLTVEVIRLFALYCMITQTDLFYHTICSEIDWAFGAISSGWFNRKSAYERWEKLAFPIGETATRSPSNVRYSSRVLVSVRIS